VIVLDTQALIWWVNGDAALSRPAKAAIQSALNEGGVLISSITAWEIAMLIKKERLALTMEVGEWLATVAAIDGLRFVPVDNVVALQSVQLPGEFHPDPADRMIVALARHLAVPLVTADRKIRGYKHVRTIW
jgi:PIN domain nuclease of toxin-antitoxin system